MVYRTDVLELVSILMNASECKCAKCGKRAVAFFPPSAIDRLARPLPYCRECLAVVRLRALTALFDVDTSVIPKQIHYPKRKL